MNTAVPEIDWICISLMVHYTLRRPRQLRQRHLLSQRHLLRRLAQQLLQLRHPQRVPFKLQPAFLLGGRIKDAMSTDSTDVFSMINWLIAILILSSHAFSNVQHLVILLQAWSIVFSASAVMLSTMVEFLQQIKETAIWPAQGIQQKYVAQETDYRCILLGRLRSISHRVLRRQDCHQTGHIWGAYSQFLLIPMYQELTSS
jgi:hypothetical protein